MKSYVINTLNVPALCFCYFDVIVYVKLMYSLDGQRYINTFHNVPEYFPNPLRMLLLQFFINGRLVLWNGNQPNAEAH